jgi:hypothetical protein
MKLRNKKTGKIGNFCYGYTNELWVSWQKDDGFWGKKEYKSLDELNGEWEDYEEPKGIQDVYNVKNSVYIEMGSKEEAEEAVEKLKAWKRLKDKGAMFKEWFWDENYGTCIIIGDSKCSYIDDGDEQNKKDLDLLFSGEDD